MKLATHGYQVRVADTTQSVADHTRVEARDERTTVLLIRYAHTHAIGRSLCGRQLGITLSGVGAVQAEELARALARTTRLAAIYSSPLERATVTAHPLANHQHTTVAICDALVEIDFGDWTGQTFAELDDDPRWHAFNRARASAIIPGGEAPHVVQQRMVAAVARLAALHRGTTIALVSHADVVRFALLQYLSVSLDRCHEIEIAPASISAVTVSADAVRILFVNREAAAMRHARQ